eukprot:12629654-Alexandrium_andersonii.AAC.1
MAQRHWCKARPKLSNTCLRAVVFVVKLCALGGIVHFGAEVCALGAELGACGRSQKALNAP